MKWLTDVNFKLLWWSVSYSSPVYITVSETHAVLFGEPVLIICSREPEQKSSDHDYIRLDNRWEEEEDGVTLEQRSEKMRSRTGSIKANKLFTKRACSMGTMAAVCVERDRTLVAALASEGYSSVSWRALHCASVFFLVVLTQSNSSSTWNMTTRGLWDIKGNWAVVGCILHLVRARPWEHDRVSDDARDYDGLTLKVTANKERHTGMKGSRELRLSVTQSKTVTIPTDRC